MSSSRDRIATYSKKNKAEWHDSAVVLEKDTLLEVTTITIRENEFGDTLHVTTVTDRIRARSRDNIALQWTRIDVKTDTVFIQQDSVIVKEVAVNRNQSGKTTLHNTLKWLFWSIMALIGLVITIKIFGR